jgi:hypothetical protein
MNKMPPKPQSGSSATANSLKTVNPELAQRVDCFLEETSLACWYKLYTWNCDKWERNNGFACIFKMESDFRTKLKGKRGLSTEDFRRIAVWGIHHKPRSVRVKKDPDLSELRRAADINVLVEVYERVLKGVSVECPRIAGHFLKRQALVPRTQPG